MSPITVALCLTFFISSARLDSLNEYGIVSTTQSPRDEALITTLQKNLELCSKMEDVNLRITTLETQAKETRNSIQSQRNETDSSKSKIEELNRQVSTFQNLLKEEQKKNQQMEERINEFERTYNESLENFENYVEELRRKNDELQEKFDGLERKIQSSQNTSYQPTKPSYQTTVQTPTDPDLPKNCKEVKNRGNETSGIYWIRPKSEAFQVFCEMNEKGGGWTVIQKRFDGFQDFYLNWDDYKRGFGNLSGEFWLGLEHIHQLTESGDVQLLVKLKDRFGEERTASYAVFGIGGEAEGYKLTRLAGYNGNAGDSLNYHLNAQFYTKDRNNTCAVDHEGGWWFQHCLYSNLNGKYYGNGRSPKRAQGINWYTFSTDNYSLKTSEMLIRP